MFRPKHRYISHFDNLINMIHFSLYLYILEYFDSTQRCAISQYIERHVAYAISKHFAWHIISLYLFNINTAFITWMNRSVSVSSTTKWWRNCSMLSCFCCLKYMSAISFSSPLNRLSFRRRIDSGVAHYRNKGIDCCIQKCDLL